MLTGLAGVFFYLFSFVLIISGMLVITARNPVHSVLFLILAFFNAAGLFLLSGAEFLALLLLVVYVGAVAVLFLFVVMMLDIDFTSFKKAISGYGVVGAIVGAVLCGELFVLFLGKRFVLHLTAPVTPTPPADTHITNIRAIGDVLYTNYVFYFELAGLILLVAMVAAIVLTLHHREGVKRQSIFAQVSRSKETAIEIRHVDSGKGL